jgi:hypothetical protein
MTPTIVSTLAALSNVGRTPVTVRLTRTLYPPDVASAAAARYGQALALDVDGSLMIRNGVDAWRVLRDFGQEILEAGMRTE